jgi:hypothetical protein
VIDTHGGYELAYIAAVKEAAEHGFLPLLSFPELNSVYRSRELFPLLRNRILQPSRPDYGEYLHQLGLDADSAEPLTVLGRSGGRRATDKLELFGVPTTTDDGRLRTMVFARGVQHVGGAEEAIDSLKPGAKLGVVADVTNPMNPKAMKVRHGAACLGYLPDYLVTELECRPEDIEVVVSRVNAPPASLHHRLLLEVTFPQEPRPFTGPRYRPLASDASQVAA